mmetsp:Transcript_19228/g.48315  ORF Transcript_19228/g.48315 Transcript_19228/m.48315 type:complete len:245 (-) Transcript_19228:176-910(-)
MGDGRRAAGCSPRAMARGGRVRRRSHCGAAAGRRARVRRRRSLRDWPAQLRVPPPDARAGGWARGADGRVRRLLRERGHRHDGAVRPRGAVWRVLRELEPGAAHQHVCALPLPWRAHPPAQPLDARAARQREPRRQRAAGRRPGDHPLHRARAVQPGAAQALVLQAREAPGQEPVLARAAAEAERGRSDAGGGRARQASAGGAGGPGMAALARGGRTLAARAQSLPGRAARVGSSSVPRQRRPA